MAGSAHATLDAASREARTPRLRRFGARRLAAGGGRRGLHPGPTAPRTARHGTRLGRDGVRQPGQRTRSRVLLQRTPRPGRLPPGGTRRGLVVVHGPAAGLPRPSSPASPCSWPCAPGAGPFPVRVVALGGALFASLWVTLFYGPQAMPNYGVAVAALAAVACFLRAPTDRGALWGLAGSAVLMAWMRPVDAVSDGPAPARPRPGAAPPADAARAALAGLAAGAAQWVIEAYTSYGGLARRLSDGSAIQGGLGWHFAVVDQLRSLGGRTLCRPCTVPLPNPLLTLWWFALPLLAALALVLAVRARRTTAAALPLACAATAAFPTCSSSATRPPASCSPPTPCSPCPSPTHSSAC